MVFLGTTLYHGRTLFGISSNIFRSVPNLLYKRIKYISFLCLQCHPVSVCHDSHFCNAKSCVVDTLKILPGHPAGVVCSKLGRAGIWKVIGNWISEQSMARNRSVVTFKKLFFTF